MRVGWFREAYIKLESCSGMRLLLTHRRNLNTKFLDLDGGKWAGKAKTLEIRSSNFCVPTLLSSEEIVLPPCVDRKFEVMLVLQSIFLSERRCNCSMRHSRCGGKF